MTASTRTLILDALQRHPKRSRRIHLPGGVYTCGKVIYWTKAWAEAMLARYPLYSGVAYRCRYCPGWHLGRRKRKGTAA